MKADPNDVTSLLDYGNFLSEMGRIKEAEEQYKPAVSADPNFATAHNNYGVLLETIGYKEEAENSTILRLKQIHNML